MPTQPYAIAALALAAPSADAFRAAEPSVHRANKVSMQAQAEVLPELDMLKAGDEGWRPADLGFGEVDDKAMVLFRDAELKHGRLAMLGAAGWPMSELLNPTLSNLVGATSVMEDTAGRAPALFNGGLGDISFLYWMSALGLAAYIEYTTYDLQFKVWADPKKFPDYQPGRLGFDPLGLETYNWAQYNTRGDEERAREYARFQMNAAEIRNGRLAMLAITGFSVQEFVWGTPVVEQTPIFFLTPAYDFLAKITA